MSTSSVTIVRGYISQLKRTDELFRFYSAYDGYPEGHGLLLAWTFANRSAHLNGITWTQELFGDLLTGGGLEGTPLEGEGAPVLMFESRSYDDIDIDYLYVVEGTLRSGATMEDEGGLAITISCRGVHMVPGDTYAQAMAQNPLFSGTPEQFIAWVGKGVS